MIQCLCTDEFAVHSPQTPSNVGNYLKRILYPLLKRLILPFYSKFLPLCKVIFIYYYDHTFGVRTGTKYMKFLNNMQCSNAILP